MKEISGDSNAVEAEPNVRVRCKEDAILATSEDIYKEIETNQKDGHTSLEPLGSYKSKKDADRK